MDLERYKRRHRRKVKRQTRKERFRSPCQVLVWAGAGLHECGVLTSVQVDEHWICNRHRERPDLWCFDYACARARRSAKLAKWRLDIDA